MTDDACDDESERQHEKHDQTRCRRPPPSLNEPTRCTRLSLSLDDEDEDEDEDEDQTAYDAVMRQSESAAETEGPHATDDESDAECSLRFGPGQGAGSTNQKHARAGRSVLSSHLGRTRTRSTKL